MARRFSLDGVRKGVRARYEQLGHPGSREADVRSLEDKDVRDDKFKPFSFDGPDFDRTQAPKDAMRKFWRQYETTPIVRKPISSFAGQVMEPGYFLQSDVLEPDDLNEIRHWLERSAIIEGMPGKDFRLLAKKSVIQREVRGTALIEKAPHKEDKDKLAGLKLINPETVEVVTRPGQSILLAPDDNENLDIDELPTTPQGEAAAYLQDVGETDAFFGTPVRDRAKNVDEDKIAFARDEIIKLTRDADVGDIFGTSRVEAVSQRIEGLNHKLQDNDEAIASKAYPLWLFFFGTEDEPFESEKIREFMSSHEMENFHPGMKQGVRGDVSVDTISGEVADIAEYLKFDLNWILSVMPMPKFALGAFGGQAVGQIGGVAQQRDLQRQIQEARLELENEFTPLVREVAEQQGFSEEEVKDLRLKIGKPGQEETPIGTNEQVIRYISGAQKGNQQQQQQQQPQQPQQPQQQGSHNAPNTSRGSDGDSGENPLGINPNDETPGVDIKKGPAPEENDDYGYHVWNDSANVAELSLADSRKEVVSNAVFDTLVNARDMALDDIEDRFDASESGALLSFGGVAGSATDRAIRQASLRRTARPTMKEVIENVNDEFGQRSKFSAQLSVKHFSRNVENASRDALEELMRKMRLQLRRGVEAGESFDAVRSRLLHKFDDATLRARAELIAHMELRNAEEATKLQMFEESDDVVGVQVHNEDPSTPLTQSLDGAKAYFDSEDTISEQLMNHTRAEFLHQGFKPLPSSPPFHFNDTTTLKPITEDN